uniref:Uncharacterized protein n=1 Tax=Onchocerca volvulus TaxID=6282 RepID=A0A8R1Y345_ONCVO
METAWLADILINDNYDKTTKIPEKLLEDKAAQKNFCIINVAQFMLHEILRIFHEAKHTCKCTYMRTIRNIHAFSLVA